MSSHAKEAKGGKEIKGESKGGMPVACGQVLCFDGPVGACLPVYLLNK